MRLRAPAHEDAPAVLEVVVARDMADRGMPDHTLEDIREAWGVSSFDLAADAVVAETDEGVIAGYAAVVPPGTLVVVAPGYEGSGIGTRLLAWAEQRDRELGRGRHRQAVASGNARQGDSLVGFLLARRWDEEGVCFVDLLGVHPNHRRRGIATTLLTTAFGQFASAGLARAQLGVASDNLGALRFYERCGMSARFMADTYERPVRLQGGG